MKREHEMENVHGHNRVDEKTVNVALSLSMWAAFHLAFWPSLAAVAIKLIARV